MTVEELCHQLEEALQNLLSREEQIAAMAATLARYFSVETHEVALFLLDDKKALLHFHWPEKLSKFGFIPLSSHHSLAARTLREDRGSFNNQFADTLHASAFERVSLEQEKMGRPQPIQKILSVPVPGAEEPVGVLQISRKGQSAVQAGADFTDADLEALQRAARIVAGHL